MALGMLRYGYHYTIIQALLLPSMTTDQMKSLIKHRIAPKAGPNLIRVLPHPSHLNTHFCTHTPGSFLNASLFFW